MEEYHTIKSRVDVFLKSFKLRLKTGDDFQDFNKYCRDASRRPFNIIVSDFDALSETETKTNITLAEEVDDILADELLSLQLRGGDYEQYHNGKHRFNRILRRMGTNYFMGMKSYRATLYNQLRHLRWNETDSIVTFNNIYESHVAKCNDVDLFANSLDQVQHYLDIISEGREDHVAILTAKSLLQVKKSSKLQKCMQEVTEVVINQISSGIVPKGFQVNLSLEKQKQNFHSPPAQYSPTQNYSQAPNYSHTPNHSPTVPHQSPAVAHYSQTKPRSTDQSMFECFNCNQLLTDYQDLKRHWASCPGSGHQCSICAHFGHTEQACARHENERKSRAKNRKELQKSSIQKTQTHYTLETNQSASASLFNAFCEDSYEVALICQEEVREPNSKTENILNHQCPLPPDSDSEEYCSTDSKPNAADLIAHSPNAADFIAHSPLAASIVMIFIAAYVLLYLLFAYKSLPFAHSTMPFATNSFALNASLDYMNNYEETFACNLEENLEKESFAEACLDTGSNTIILNSLNFFESIDMSKKGEIDLLDASTGYIGLGIAAFKISPTGTVYRLLPNTIQPPESISSRSKSL